MGEISDQFSLRDGYSLRPATEDDLPAILGVERRSYPLPWTEQAFREEFQKPYCHFLVLTDDETDTRVLAYVLYWMVFEECHILNVTVDPEWRGLGIAKRLVRHAISEAVKKDLQRVFLEVRKSNAAAVALYQKLGFYVEHIKKAFYDDGEDAYFMQLFLQKPNQF